MNAGQRWRPATAAERDAPITRLGGRPSWAGQPRWPWYQDQPLEFIGQVALDGGRLLLAFLSFEEDTGSWRAEGGGNAAIVEPGGEVPDWVQARPDPDGPAALGDQVLVPADPLPTGGAPPWRQAAQVPAAAPEFVLALASFPDPLGMITFGDGGVAYLFVAPDRRRARLLWQS